MKTGVSSSLKYDQAFHGSRDYFFAHKFCLIIYIWKGIRKIVRLS